MLETSVVAVTAASVVDTIAVDTTASIAEALELDTSMTVDSAMLIVGDIELAYVSKLVGVEVTTGVDVPVL